MATSKFVSVVVALAQMMFENLDQGCLGLGCLGCQKVNTGYSNNCLEMFKLVAKSRVFCSIKTKTQTNPSLGRQTDWKISSANSLIYDFGEPWESGLLLLLYCQSGVIFIGVRCFKQGRLFGLLVCSEGSIQSYQLVPWPGRWVGWSQVGGTHTEGGQYCRLGITT